MQTFRRTYEGQLEQLPAIHDFVAEVATEQGLSEDDAFACRLATDEAAWLTSSEHAYAGGPAKWKWPLGARLIHKSGRP